MTSYIIYNGPSLIDGKPIVCIAQTKTDNKKTGNMIQTYIIRSDIDPVSASRTGEDYSICGNCMHRGKVAPHKVSGQAENRTCYVTLAHGPLQKYKGFIKGLYPEVSGHKDIQDIGFGRMVRIGTYGDPVAVPQYVWDSLVSRCDGWTAYTHGEINLAPHMFMTSADSYDEAVSAWDRGERTFRVIPDIFSLDKHREFLCPASEEMGKRSNCAKCKACSGTESNAKSVAIVAHGTSGKKLKGMLV